MLIDVTDHLSAGLTMLQGLVQWPDNEKAIMQLLVRWLHFVAGIAWIGLLYFFNLVNVNFMKALDGPTKKIVVPALMPKALWYFRWGAVVTVLVGLMYYTMYIVPVEAKAANLSRSEWMGLLGLWLLIILVTYAILFYFYRVPALTKDGRVLAVAVAVLVVVMSWLILWVLGTKSNAQDAMGISTYLGNKTLSIGVGGAMGILMMLNVWGIIWPAQKRIIAATEAGTPPDATLARRAFLASRTNAWLSLPMLLLMAQSHDYAFFAGK
jgi:uncharacterized membrane protein